MSSVTQISHPLAEHSLTILRKTETATAEFRRHANSLSKILILEATRDLTLTPTPIETPVAPMEGHVLTDDLVIVPVLRAGLAMLFAVQEFLPSSSVGFVGLERDERTAKAREYYRKIPQTPATRRVLILDPMLATGGSLEGAIGAAQAKGAVDIRIVCIVAAPEGIAHIQSCYPNVDIVTASVDERLNTSKYIVPGLGDFGDRYFGT